MGRVLVAVLGSLLLVTAPARAQEAPFSLRADADRAGVFLGSAATAAQLDDPRFAALARRHVNVLTFENEAKWAIVHPERGRYDFRRADRVARFASSNGMRMRGHVLIWHAEMPEWLSALEPTREEAMAILRDHIFVVVGHFREQFPGLVTQWDVVNEGIDNDATRRQNLWQRWIGDDYIDLAFRWAREAAGPDVKLFYNDYFDAGMTAGAEVVGGDFDDGDAVPSALPGATGSLGCDAVAKCAAVRDLVAGMVRRGVPIDGVGFQAHEVSPNPSDYRALTAWVGELGLEWAITELDVPLPRGTKPAGRAQHQAPAFRRTLAACLDDRACDTVVTWGLTDRYSWWRTLIPGGLFSDALHFDDEYAPKPAAFALHEELVAAPADAREAVHPSPKLVRRAAGGGALRVSLRGRGMFEVKRVRWRLSPCRTVPARGSEFEAVVRPCRAARGRRTWLRASLYMHDGRVVRHGVRLRVR